MQPAAQPVDSYCSALHLSTCAQVNGSFAFVIYDELQKRVFAARDAEVRQWLIRSICLACIERRWRIL